MAPPWARGRIEDDFRIIAEDVATRVSPGRASSTATSWSVWTSFCHTYNIDPYLNTEDPIYAILLLAKQYRCGEISPSGTFVRSRTVEDAVRAVGQTLALMGKKDPRLTATVTLTSISPASYPVGKKMTPLHGASNPYPFMSSARSLTSASSPTRPVLTP
jgi:hypothetical protein